MGSALLYGIGVPKLESHFSELALNSRSRSDFLSCMKTVVDRSALHQSKQAVVLRALSSCLIFCTKTRLKVQSEYLSQFYAVQCLGAGIIQLTIFYILLDTTEWNAISSIVLFAIRKKGVFHCPGGIRFLLHNPRKSYPLPQNFFIFKIR